MIHLPVLNISLISKDHDSTSPWKVKQHQILSFLRLTLPLVQHACLLQGKNSLAKNVLAFEPHLALFAPAQDPLFFYKAILRQAQDFLNPKGSLYFEINPNYYDEMVTLIKSFSIFDMSMRKDIFGKKRLLRLQKL